MVLRATTKNTASIIGKHSDNIYNLHPTYHQNRILHNVQECDIQFGNFHIISLRVQSYIRLLRSPNIFNEA